MKILFREESRNLQGVEIVSQSDLEFALETGILLESKSALRFPCFQP